MDPPPLAVTRDIRSDLDQTLDEPFHRPFDRFTHETELLQEALALSPDERAEMAERLLSSLDTPTTRRIEDLWAHEAEDRLDAFDRGEIGTLPAKEVFDQLGPKTK